MYESFERVSSVCKVHISCYGRNSDRLGYLVSAKKEEDIWDETEDVLREKADQAVEFVKEKTTQAMDTVAEKTEDAAETVVEKTEDAVEKIKEFTEE